MLRVGIPGAHLCLLQGVGTTWFGVLQQGFELFRAQEWASRKIRGVHHDIQ